jgi:hypothetical protein
VSNFAPLSEAACLCVLFLFYWSLTHFAGQTMPDLNFIRAEIEHKRRQIVRHRKEIQDLQRAGIATKSADELLVRMQAKVDGLCEERDRLVGDQRRKYPGTDKVINGPIERRFR